MVDLPSVRDKSSMCPPQRAEPAHVLVIERDRPARCAAVEILQGAGYRVSQVAELPAALVLLGKDDVDVVLSECHHACADPAELLGLIARRGLTLQVIGVIDGTGSDPLAWPLCGFTFDDLAKPWDATQMLRSVARALKYKHLEDERLRLIAENRQYQSELERQVAQNARDLVRSDRALMMLSRCNAAIVRATDEVGLLQEVCRLLVEVGGCAFAWAVIDEDTPRTVAVSGLNAALPWQGAQDLDGPVDEALRSDQPVIVRAASSGVLPTTALAERLDADLSACVALPMAGVGVLSVFRQRPDSFDQDEVARLVGLCEDVAHGIAGLRTRAQHARASRVQARLSLAIDQAEETVMITDLRGHIRYVNPAFVRMSGYEEHEVLGKTPSLLKSGQHSPAMYCELWTKLLEGQTWRGRLVNRRKDGSHYTVEATMSPVRDDSGTLINYLSVQHDITDRIQLESQLRQAVKMEAIGRLAGGVAHDFNNLLTVILTSCHFLEEEMRSADPMLEDVRYIQDAGKRAMSLTRQLLAFSRNQIVESAVVDVNDVVRAMQDMLTRMIPEDVRLHLDLQDGLNAISADVSQLEQVLLNLVVNARDALPVGGEVCICTRNLSLDSAAAAGLGLDAGRYVQLSVEDDGMGMEEAVRAHVFEPFFTTKEVGRGTGLGLSTVFGIVSQCGGAIQVHSVLGEGCRFDLLFPRVERPVSEPNMSTGRRVVEGRGEVVLVVEDEPMVRALACRILRRAGYEVLEANNGGEALLIAEKAEVRLDLLFTDVVMPHLNGPALAQRMLVLRPDLKVVFTSGYPDDTIAQHGVVSGQVSLVAKPYAADAVAQVVRGVLDGTRPGGVPDPS